MKLNHGCIFSIFFQIEKNQKASGSSIQGNSHELGITGKIHNELNAFKVFFDNSYYSTSFINYLKENLATFAQAPNLKELYKSTYQK